MSPTSVEPHSITHVQQNVIPHLTSQMAQMQLSSGGVCILMFYFILINTGFFVKTIFVRLLKFC